MDSKMLKFYAQHISLKSICISHIKSVPLSVTQSKTELIIFWEKIIISEVMAVSVHTIAFKGYSGIGFILLMLACICYFMAYTSNSWALRENDTRDYMDNRAGIWESCVCTAFHHDDADVEGWFC